MSFSFHPDYFLYSRILYDDSSVENCITLFCSLSDDGSKLFKYDSKLVHELLSLNPQCSDMEFLSIIFDFNDILTRRVDKSQPILALKKLTAISFFLNQLLKQGNKECVNEIDNLFQISKQLFFSKNQEIINAVSVTYSFVLNVLSSRCRDLCAFTVSMDSIFSIIRFIIDFFVNQKNINHNLLPQVISFLLNSIHFFSSKMELNDKVHHLLVDIMKAISSFNLNIQIDLNYFSLIDKIFSFLEKDSVFPKKTKIFIFSFLSVLISRQVDLIDFLFNDDYLNKSVQFIKSIINNVKSTFIPVPIKMYKKLRKTEIAENTVVTIETFNEGYNVEVPKIEKPDDTKYALLFPKNKDIINILNTYNRICKVVSSRYFELMTKTMYAILKSKDELSLPMHSFLVYCLNSMISENTNKAIEAFHTRKLHLILQLEIYKSGFVKEVSSNIANTLFYLSQNCKTVNFFHDVIYKFAHDCKTMVIEEQFAINIIKNFMLCEEKFSKYFESFKFDEVIANLMLDLRAYHIAAQNEKIIQAIVHSRTVLFEFIQMVLQLKIIKDILISSEYFIYALCQMVYEKNLIQYVVSIWAHILTISKSTDSQVHSIIIFIQSIFDRKNEPGFAEILRRIIQALVVHFHQNPSDMSNIFFHTKLLDYLINFVLYTKSKEDLFSLFQLFRNFSKFQELVKEYVLDMAPFMQLQPLVESQSMIDDIKDWLWSFVCGVTCQYLDQIRPIKNALPLSLIYCSLKRDNAALFEFIVFLRKCCESDQPSALEVCAGDIPSLLIDQIRDYRQYEKGDSLFEEVLRILAILSQYSMKSKDLRSLFQTMTLINGQKSPFYTQDLLKLLQNIFGMKLEMPCAFISSSGRSSLFKVKETKLLNSFTDFSIFFEFELKSDNWKPKSELLRIASDENTLLLWFKNDQLVLTFLKTEEPLELVIDVKFPVNVWIQLALIFSDSNFSLYMDSKLMLTVKVPKFHFKSKISCSFARSFACNLSNFIFTSGIIDSKNVKNLLYFPKYTPTSFDITEIDNFPRIFQSLFTGSISASAVFIFSALVTHNQKLPNLAKMYVKCPAVFSGQAFTFSPQPKQTLRCIGGIPTIYPLFSQLDQPYTNGLLSNLLAFVTALFNNCMLNQEEFYYSNSFQVIACLLASKITDVDDDIIDRISDMYEAIDMRLLIRQMFNDLLFNVRLWIYLPIVKQDNLYKAFIKLFENSPLGIKKVIVTQLTFRHILMLIRVFLWSVNTNTNSNPKLKDQNTSENPIQSKNGPSHICLLDKPRIDHASEKVGIYRPNDLSLVRANLLHLAELIVPIRFTINDAETLIHYSLDMSDPVLCSEFQVVLTKLLQDKNPTILKVVAKYFTYNDFFPLITSDNEKVRVNSLNILMLFTREEHQKLLSPYSTTAWIDGITRYINMKYTTSYFADVALSYAFGYYKKGHPIDTYVKFSKNEHVNGIDSQISIEKVMPLIMLIISKLPEKVGKIYTTEIKEFVTTKRFKLVKTKCWDHPFILYILSRLTVRRRTFNQPLSDQKAHRKLVRQPKIIHVDETTMDESGRDILLSLSYVYMDMVKMGSIRYLLHVLSFILKRDVYFIMEAIFFAILNHSLLTGKFKEESIPTFVNAIFEYMFVLPDIDSYASLSFESTQVDKCLSLPSNLGWSIPRDNSSSLLSSKNKKLLATPSPNQKNRFKPVKSISQEFSELSSSSSSAANSAIHSATLSSIHSTAPSTSPSEDRIASLANDSNLPLTSKDNSNSTTIQTNNQNDDNSNLFIMKRSFAREKYQDLINIRMKCEKLSLNYFYAIRIDPFTGTWVDEKLAECFCRLLSLYPSLGNDEYNLLLFSFTISIGIQNPNTYPTFYPFSHSIKSNIPLKGHLSEMKTKCFICYLAGMAKIFYNTALTHCSHKVLFEDFKVFNGVIMDVFKLSVPQNFNNIDEFHSFYLGKDNKNEYEINVLLMAIEKFSNEVETTFMNGLASQVSKATTKDYQTFIDFRSPAINPSLLSSGNNHQNPQIMMQLQRFASSMRNAQTKGLKKYIESWRIMSNEKGPWCPPEKSFTHHWKLENSIQKIMRRGMMKENFAFTNHSDASLLRDTSNRVDNELGINGENNNNDDDENYKSIMKKLRITDFIGDRTVETLFQDSELGEINKNENVVQLQSDDIIIKVDAKHITMKDVNSGSFMLTSELLIFDSPSKYLDVSLDEVVYVFKRRYLAQDTSLEIFTNMHRAYFFEFVGDQRDQIIHELLRINPKNLKFVQDTDDSIKRLIEKTQRVWQDGKMSNFDYLMAINMFSGRTYNDLGQYPVFPWVIADYTSDVLNLNDLSVYRDLAKPLGALTEERLRMLKERLDDADGMDMPYLYGSFYSSSAVVIGYLIRVEPFTSLHIKLQSGKFDLSDRLFNSIPKAWESVTTAMMDFRELIPEFFYLPDFLVNANNFDLGISISISKTYNINPISLNSKSCQENRGNRSSFIPFNSPTNKKNFVKSLQRNKATIYSSSTNLSKSLHLDPKKNSMQNWKQVNNSTSILTNGRSDQGINNDEPINVNYCNNIKYCDVELPPWASSPLDFIKKNRAALESPVVSATLPYWIDMIFGISSRGEKAVQIDNIFHPFFFSEIQQEFDPYLVFKREYAACFGQAPSQIFEYSHPAKLVLKKQLKIHEPHLVIDCGKGKPILSIESDEYGFITVVNSDYNVFSNRDNKVRPLFNINSVIMPEDINICTKLIRTKGKIALSTAPWDRCFCITHINEGLLFTKRFHVGKISAVAITEHRYATASLDGTVALWKKPNIPPDPPLMMPKLPSVQNVITSSSSPALQHLSSSLPTSNLIPASSSNLNTNPNLMSGNININAISSSSVSSTSINSSNFSGGLSNNLLSGSFSSSQNLTSDAFKEGLAKLPDNQAKEVGTYQSVPSIFSMQIESPTENIENKENKDVKENKENKDVKPQINSEFGLIPVATITKHCSPVIAVDINETANIIVSGARDGTLVSSSLMNGRVIKMIKITNTIEPIYYYNNESANETDLNHSTSFLNIDADDDENKNDNNNTNDANNLESEYDYYDEDDKLDEDSHNAGLLNEYGAADENIDDPNIIKISSNGTICVCISRPASSIIKVYDINMNEISCCLFDSYIRCMTVFEWYNGREMLAVALRNKKIELIKIPSFKHVWTFNGYNTSSIEVVNSPSKALLIGTMEGKVLKIDIEDINETSIPSDLSSSVNQILNIL